MTEDGFAAGGEFAGGGVGEEEAVLFSEEEARRDGVDADFLRVILAEVDGQPLREVADGGLGGRVGGDFGEGAEGVHAGDVEDDALAGAGHFLAEDLGGQEGADEVEVEDELDGVCGHIEEGHFGAGGGFFFVATGAVDEDVDAAVGGEDLVLGGFDGGLVEDVAPDGESFAAVLLDLIDDFEGEVLLKVEDGHGRAGLGEANGHFAAEHAAAAGDGDDFTGEVEEIAHEMRPFERSVKAGMRSKRSMPAARPRHDRHLRAALLRPVGVEELAAGCVGAFVSMRAEEVALALEEVGRQARGAVAVVVGQGGHEGGGGHAVGGGEGDDFAPLGLALLDLLVEIGVKKEIDQAGVLGVGVGDLLQKASPDDAAAAPNRGDFREIELPLVLVLGFAHELEALRIRTNLRAIQRIADGGDEVIAIAGQRHERTLQMLAGLDAFFLKGGDAAGEDGLRDGIGRDAHIQGVRGGPLARALLAGGVEDVIDKESVLVDGVRLLQDVGRDLDQVAVQVAGVPRLEDLADLVGLHAQQIAHERVCFADELHVDIFNAVVDHLDVVAGAVGSDIGGAGHASHHGFAGGVILQGLAGLGIDLGGDGFPDGLEMVPRIRIAAGHHGWAEARAQLAPGDARPEILALGGIFLLAADRVRPLAVAAIHDDVVRLDARLEKLLHHGIDGGAGLYQDDDLAGFLDRRDQVLERFAAHQPARRIFAGDEFLHDVGGAVIDRDLVAVIGNIEGEVLAHDGQADEADVCGCCHD